MEQLLATDRIRILFSSLFFTVYLMIAPFSGEAEEVKWLVDPSFEGEELEKVREWEKTWAGETINRSNVAQVKEFVPEGVYDVMTDASKWGDFDFSFVVVPYKTYKPTAGLIEATHNYSSLAKLTPDESVEDYHTMAGVPFPKPKTGLEIVWNYFMWSRGDEFSRPKGPGTPVDARTKIERGSITSFWMAYYVNRVDKPPLPSIPKNRRNIRKAQFSTHDAPPHMQDFATLYIKYIDLKKPDDGWMYWPRFRKITRIETSRRDDVYDGLDWIQDDFPDGFADKPYVNNYKLVGRKTLLLSRDTDTSQYERQQGMTLFRGVQRELINAYVVEVTHKKPGYVYPKQLWFTDPETWAILFKLIYNRQGELWKLMDVHTELREIYGAEVAVCEAYSMIDLIRLHGTVNICKNDLTTEWSRDMMFSIRNLDRRSY
jgi:hypothetical protein